MPQLEVYEDVAATFDSMSAVRMPLCLVLDAAASLVMALFRMGLIDLALQVLRLKASAAHQVLQRAATGELPPLPARQDSCSLCAKQQRAEDASSTLRLLRTFDEKGSNGNRLKTNIHLMQAAGGYVLLHAAATASFFQREEPCFLQADTREAILKSFQSLEVLITAWGILMEDSTNGPLCSELQYFSKLAVTLTARLCRCLASGGYSGTAAELLNRCLHHVEDSEPGTTSYHWRHWWQLAQLRAARGEWSEVQMICSAVSKAISERLEKTSGVSPRKEAAHTQLVFLGLLVKSKFWSQQLQSTGVANKIRSCSKQTCCAVLL